MTIGRPLIRISETTSTMHLASDLAAAGAVSGTAVLAGYQSAGRGRAGRAWDVAPWTSILLSFVTDSQRERSSLGALSLVIGLAVADTVDTFTNRQSSIKWPNDVLVNEQKIAGILIVNKALPDRSGTCLVTGIGLNVNNQPAELPATGTSLAIEAGMPLILDDVLDLLLANLSEMLDRFERGNLADTWDRLNARLAFRGEIVRVVDGAREIEGRQIGIAPDGSLRIETRPGQLATVVAGDLVRGPRKLG